MRTAPTLYEDVLAIVKSAASEADAAAVFPKLNGLGFQEANATDHKFHEGYIRTDGYDTVFVQYRYYDTSKAFSIRPDMNVFLIKLLGQQGTLKEKQIKFLDAS
ncbi:hypothetical protein [Thalassobius sp. I31.1]|uniref:hypothetical protein n=1 Tax=Thalassobius sp. I31.1 TaxID=2109912 RepID=UPI000D1BAB72|nr:hypothetical protein [Thalassobius sp. I31.1]